VAESLGKFELHIGEIEKSRNRRLFRAPAAGEKPSRRPDRSAEETANLVKALRQPTGRGQWAKCSSAAWSSSPACRSTATSNSSTPPPPTEENACAPTSSSTSPAAKNLVVDSKTPMDGYLDALEAIRRRAREEALRRHSRQVARTSSAFFQELRRPFANAPEFHRPLPAQRVVFSAALQTDPGLIERGGDQGLILAHAYPR